VVYSSPEEVNEVKRTFWASVWREGNLYVAQCLDVDVASQGETEEEALANLREALELYFEEPRPTELPRIVQVEAEVALP
jgi:predicted RNase H-like HicB family nuclease